MTNSQPNVMIRPFRAAAVIASAGLIFGSFEVSRTPPSWTTPSVLASQEDQAEALEDAKALYEQGRFAQALTALQSVIEALERRAQSGGPAMQTETRLQLEDAYLHLGLSYVALDDPDGAMSAFGSVLALAPDKRLDPRVYAPKVMEIFERARARQPASGPTPPPTTVTVPPSDAGADDDASDEGGLSTATIGLIAGGAGAAAFIAAASGGDEGGATTTTPLPVTTSIAATTSVASTTTVAANAIDVLYRVNGSRGGNFSCSQPMSFTIDATNNTNQAIRINRYELRMVSLSAQCSTHTPAVDGSYNRDLEAGASAELRRVDLSGDLCRERGEPGCNWRAVVNVFTAAGTFQDSFELTTSN